MNFYQQDNLFKWNNQKTNQLTTDDYEGADHFELNGINMVVFDVFKEKLDPLNENTRWRGFSPRWTLPTKLRSTVEKSLSTSTILVIMDTAREVQLGIGPYFSQTILGENEMIASE